MVYGDFKDFLRRTTFDKGLINKAFNVAKNPKYDRYKGGLAFMVYNFFDKKTQVVVLIMKLSKINTQLKN